LARHASSANQFDVSASALRCLLRIASKFSVLHQFDYKVTQFTPPPFVMAQKLQAVPVSDRSAQTLLRLFRLAAPVVGNRLNASTHPLTSQEAFLPQIRICLFSRDVGTSAQAARLLDEFDIGFDWDAWVAHIDESAASLQAPAVARALSALMAQARDLCGAFASRFRQGTSMSLPQVDAVVGGAVANAVAMSAYLLSESYLDFLFKDLGNQHRLKAAISCATLLPAHLKDVSSIKSN
jgi:hypothetical protein